MQRTPPSEPLLPTPPRVEVRADGHYAAIAQAGEVALFRLPALERDAEIAVDRRADAYDARWLGARLLVASKFPTRTSLQLVDIDGDVPIVSAVLELADACRLVATTATHALGLGARGILVVQLAGSQLTPHALPSCTRVTTGAAAGGRFLLASAQTIEIWDPETRSPLRRLHLPRSVEIARLGGHEDLVWFTTREHPSRIEIVPLAAGRSFAHELPDAVTSVASGSCRDTILCTTARGTVFELGARSRTRAQLTDSTTRTFTVACGVAGTAPGILLLDADRLHFQPSRMERPGAERVAPTEPTPPTRLELQHDPGTGFKHLRRRARPLPDADLPAVACWRDELAAWWIARRESTASPPPRTAAIADMLARIDCADLLPAATALYAAHLCGEAGVAPYEIARCLPVSNLRWEEALGRGRLVRGGIAVLVDSRLVLSRAMQEALDADVPLGAEDLHTVDGRAAS